MIISFLSYQFFLSKIVKIRKKQNFTKILTVIFSSTIFSGKFSLFPFLDKAARETFPFWSIFRNTHKERELDREKCSWQLQMQMATRSGHRRLTGLLISVSFFPFLTNSLFFCIFENRTYEVFCTFSYMYSAQIKAIIYYTVVTPNKARKNSRETGQIRQFSPHFRPHFWPICRQFLGQIK